MIGKGMQPSSAHRCDPACSNTNTVLYSHTVHYCVLFEANKLQHHNVFILWYCVTTLCRICYMGTNVSTQVAASIFRIKSQDEGSRYDFHKGTKYEALTQRKTQKFCSLYPVYCLCVNVY
jgi:hypothetical protein